LERFFKEFSCRLSLSVFTDIEKPEKRIVRFSKAYNHDLGAGGRSSKHIVTFNKMTIAGVVVSRLSSDTSFVLNFIAEADCNLSGLRTEPTK